MNKFQPIKITANGPGVWQSLQETWRYLGLLRAFTLRDLKVRYAQTYLGYLWSVIQPLFGLAAVFILFSKIAGIETDTVPYLPFALSGLIFWNYFNYVVTQSASSLIGMQAMIKKIYFPRLSVPISKSLVGSVDWLVGLSLLTGLLVYYNLWNLNLFLAPLILVLTAFCAIGIGLIASSLSIRFRDLQQIVPFAIQLLFFLTPVAYPSSLLGNLLPEKWLWLAYLNPMMGILELWRNWLFATPISEWVLLSIAIAFLLFIFGILLFTKTEKKMADFL